MGSDNPGSSTLRRYLNAHRQKIVPGRSLFSSPEGLRYDPDNFSSDLRKVNVVARLPWTCLDYWHTFGSQLAMKGESLYKNCDALGELARDMPAALRGPVA